jgi:hypothetical protein
MITKAINRPTVPPRPRRSNSLQPPSVENQVYQQKISTLPHGIKLKEIFDNESISPESSSPENDNLAQNGIILKTLLRRKTSLVRQRSFCTSSYMEGAWLGSTLPVVGDLHKSNSYSDLADIKDMDLNSWDKVKQVGQTSVSRKGRRSQNKSTIRRRLNQLARGDQMSIRVSCTMNDEPPSKDAVTKK